MDRYQARTHGRFEIFGHGREARIRLWTTEEEPIDLYAVGTQVAGMVFEGQTFLGVDFHSMNVRCVEVRWPGTTFRPVNHLSFATVFRALTDAPPAAAGGRPVLLWSKISPVAYRARGHYYVTMYVQGCAALVADVENEVFRFLVEFEPSAWGPK
jgi:hypothetical protein